MTDAALRKIAWIGMGAMGRPMSDRLVAAGYEVVSISLRVDRDRASVLEALDGASVAITCLPGPPEVRAAWLGTGGLIDCAPRGCVLIDVSTVGPAVARELEGVAATDGFDALDCPVSGGPQGAATGSLAVMAGGRADVIDRVRPVLNEFGTVHLCGGTGSGQTVKLINQAVLAGFNGGLGLAYALTVRNEIDPALVHQVLNDGAARGFMTEVLWPLMAENRLEGGFAVQHMRKDLSLTRTLAADSYVSTALLDTVDAWFLNAEETCGPAISTQAIGQGVLQ